jgi:hypothetical protein
VGNTANLYSRAWVRAEVKSDLCCHRFVDKLAESYNQVDVLVNNAAAGLGDLAQVKRSADSHHQSPGPVVRWQAHFYQTKFLECYE